MLENLVLTTWFIPVILIIALWAAVWKLIALWKCGRNNQLVWFIVMAILNTAGILPIVYLLFFQKTTVKKTVKKKAKKVVKKAAKKKK